MLLTTVQQVQTKNSIQIPVTSLKQITSNFRRNVSLSPISTNGSWTNEHRVINEWTHVFICWPPHTCLYVDHNTRAYMLTTTHVFICWPPHMCLYVDHHTRVYMLTTHVFICWPPHTCLDVDHHTRVYMLTTIHVFICVYTCLYLL